MSDITVPDEDVEAARARLAARGLVRTEPELRIRELVPTPPGPAPVEAAIADAVRTPVIDRTDAEDDLAIGIVTSGPQQVVRCASCGTNQRVAVDAAGFTCDTCAKAWRWAVCASCDDLALVFSRQESWRCGACRAHTRSWWRTATAAREAHDVVARKRSAAARLERARVVAMARRRRWKLITAGVVSVLLSAAAAVVFTATDQSSVDQRAHAACARFDRFRSDLANGTRSGPAVAAEIARIAEDADGATPTVDAAADALASSGRPGDTAFLVAATEMADACTATP